MNGSFSFSSIFPLVFFVIFAIISIMVIITFIRAMGMSKKNRSQPRISAPAKVISRRTFSPDGKGRTFFMTFEYKTGDRAEYAVTEDAYAYFAEGDEGTIVVQGTKFISFTL